MSIEFRLGKCKTIQIYTYGPYDLDHTNYHPKRTLEIKTQIWVMRRSLLSNRTWASDGGSELGRWWRFNILIKDWHDQLFSAWFPRAGRERSSRRRLSEGQNSGQWARDKGSVVVGGRGVVALNLSGLWLRLLWVLMSVLSVCKSN